MARQPPICSIALALDGEQHGALDGARIDPLALPFERAERQGMLLKNQADGLEIELGAEVEHREIFVIEGLGDLRLLELALGQIVVELAVRLYVPLDVHAHEGGELDEARIDATE